MNAIKVLNEVLLANNCDFITVETINDGNTDRINFRCLDKKVVSKLNTEVLWALEQNKDVEFKSLSIMPHHFSINEDKTIKNQEPGFYNLYINYTDI